MSDQPESNAQGANHASGDDDGQSKSKSSNSEPSSPHPEPETGSGMRAILAKRQIIKEMGNRTLLELDACKQVVSKMISGKEVGKRTLLDLDACRQVVSRMISDKEEHIQSEPRSQEPFQPVQQIEKYRRATPCESAWDKLSGTNQLRNCALCTLFVYDFTGMEQPEAEKIVFQREGKKNPSLFRRRDGKYLTSDCPVGVSRGRRTLFLIVGATLIFATAITVLMLSPHPPAVTVTSSPAKVESQTEGAGTEFTITRSKNTKQPQYRSPQVVPPPAKQSSLPDSGQANVPAPAVSGNANQISPATPAAPEVGGTALPNRQAPNSSNQIPATAPPQTSSPSVTPPDATQQESSPYVRNYR